MAKNSTIKLNFHWNNVIEQLVPSVWWPSFLDKSKYHWHRGGRGSGKSSNPAVLEALMRMLSPDRQLVIFLRQEASTVADSQLAEFKFWVDRLDLNQHFHYPKGNASSDIVVVKGSENKILKRGLDDVSKFRSLAQPNFVWVEEPNEISLGNIQGAMQGLRGLRSESRSWPDRMSFTFNPIFKWHWLKTYGHDNQDIRDQSYYTHTTLYDNPYIGREYEKELEAQRYTNPQLYAVNRHGEWGAYEGVVYTNVDQKPFPKGIVPTHTMYGLDFGGNDPTVLVKIYVVENLGDCDDIYIEEIIHERGMDIDKLRIRMEMLKIDQRIPIYCDHDYSKHKLIREKGYALRKADKRPFTVLPGVFDLQGQRLHVHGKNAFEDMISYHWKKDKKTEDNSNNLAHANSHTPDAVRMARWTHKQYQSQGFSVIDRVNVGV